MDMNRFTQPPPGAADDPDAYQMAMDALHPVESAPTEANEPTPDAPPDDALKAALLEQAEKMKQFSEQYQDSVSTKNQQSQQQAQQLLKGNIDEQSH